MEKANRRGSVRSRGDESGAFAKTFDDFGMQSAVSRVLPGRDRNKLRADEFYDGFIVATSSPANQQPFLLRL